MKIEVPFCTCGCPSFGHIAHTRADGVRIVECKHGRHLWEFSGETREYDTVIAEMQSNLLVGWTSGKNIGLGWWI